MGLLSEQIMNALLLGCTYTLVAIGFSLFFGVVDVVVFCGGDIAIFGSFAVLIFYKLFTATGLTTFLPYWLFILLIVICGMILGAIFGKVVHLVSIKPFERASELMPLLSTIAFGIFIRELIGLFYPQGRNPQVFPDMLPKGCIKGNYLLSYKNLFIIGITFIIIAVLFIIVNKTKLGLSMQSLAQNKEVAAMIGVNTPLIISVTFIIGGTILAIGGFLIGSYYNIVRFDMGSMYGLMGYSAAVVGGLGNIYGAIVGGMLLAFAETFMTAYIPGGTAYAKVFSFLIVILFMIFKSEGIIGQKTIEKV
ncbi:MAG TPA: hypothetical protein DCK79_00600 [Candidatus Atribacteria bacterium]|nr:hypothetical protein [Candidatus Atribacteria bacterium]